MSTNDLIISSPSALSISPMGCYVASLGSPLLVCEFNDCVIFYHLSSLCGYIIYLPAISLECSYGIITEGVSFYYHVTSLSWVCGHGISELLVYRSLFTINSLDFGIASLKCAHPSCLIQKRCLCWCCLLESYNKESNDND